MRTLEADALHQRLVSHRTTHRQAEHQLAVLLAELADRRLFAELGYASAQDYAEIVLDLPKRTTRDLVRIGRKLPDFPVLAEALAAGGLHWTKAREVVSIATADTEAAWVNRARNVTSRVLEHEVAHARVGEGPPADGVAMERGPERVRVVLEMEASDAQVLRQAIALCRAQSDLEREEIGDGALAAMIAQHYLAAVADRSDTPTGERFRIVVDTCDECAHTSSPQSEVSDTVAAEAACDAEVIDMRPGPTQGHVTRTIAPVLRVKLLHGAKWKCEVDGCCNRLWLDVHHLRHRVDGGGNEAENLVILCSAHHRAVHLGGLALERDPRGAVVVTHRADRHQVVGGTSQDVRSVRGANGVDRHSSIAY